MKEEMPYHIQAVEDLKAAYSPEHFRYSINEYRKVLAHLVSSDDSSEQQIARVCILRYLDLQLSRADRWAEAEADLLAIVLRSQIELCSWAEFVAGGIDKAREFLHNVSIDVRELHSKMKKAFPAEIEPLPTLIHGTRYEPKRDGDVEDYYHKLCSKLIHPSALMLTHPELTINNPANKENLSVEILFYAWLIVDRFHDINWT